MLTVHSDLMFPMQRISNHAQNSIDCFYPSKNVTKIHPLISETSCGQTDRPANPQQKHNIRRGAKDAEPSRQRVPKTGYIPRQRCPVVDLGPQYHAFSVRRPAAGIREPLSSKC